MHSPAHRPRFTGAIRKCSCTATADGRTRMQRGCLERINRRRGSAVWQFRWSETDPKGKRMYHKKIIGTVEQYSDESAARLAVAGLTLEMNPGSRPTPSGFIAIAQLCDHFEQRELSNENTWRSHATKKIYKAYLTRWI